LLTTPQNQFHEIGALMVSMVAAMDAWNVTYLGPNLPAEEIANAVLRTGSRAVGLSIVFPHDDPGISEQLVLLRRLIGAGVPIIVGGRATASYAHALEAINAVVCVDLEHVRAVLSQIHGLERSA
jgi:methanogenic corrinoid protein MtbC1